MMLDFVRNRPDPRFRPPSNGPQLGVWQRELRAELTDLLSLSKMGAWACPPDPTEDSPVDCGSFTRTRVEIATAPDYRMPFYRLDPADGPRHDKIIIAFHGHGRGKDEVAGMASDAHGRERIARLNYAYGLRAAREGYTTIIPDVRGFGERSIGQESCRRLNRSAMAVGLSLKGVHTWDAMRLVDFIESTPDLSGRPVGAIGLSGGGGSTLWLAAMDTRIRFAVVASFLREYISVDSMHCECNLVPGFLSVADFGELAALVVPRPLYVQAGAQDTPVQYVRDAFGVARRVGIALGGEPVLEVHDGGHRWADAAVWDWIGSL
jgi:dienelactone hydrolase